MVEAAQTNLSQSVSAGKCRSDELTNSTRRSRQNQLAIEPFDPSDPSEKVVTFKFGGKVLGWVTGCYDGSQTFQLKLLKSYEFNQLILKR